MGDMMRMVIAHEVGHALGLPHNMGASCAYEKRAIETVRLPKKTELQPVYGLCEIQLYSPTW
jgi:hypothetical protein